MTDESPHLKKFRKELSTGSMSLVLLALLAGRGDEMYGYEIAKTLKDRTKGEPLFKQGTLYPVLRSLSAAELLASRVEPSVSGPPRRYYRVTDEGRAVLKDWSVAWAATRDFVDGILKGKE